MLSIAKQMYDYYVKPYLGEKGQDMVEYALMLAIIVGIGWLIYSQVGLAGNLMDKAASSSQAASSGQG